MSPRGKDAPSESEPKKEALVGREITVKCEEEWVKAIVVEYYSEPNEFVDVDCYKIVFVEDHTTQIMSRSEMEFRIEPRRSEENGPVLQGAIVICKLEGEDIIAMVYEFLHTGEVYVACPYRHDFATATISDGFDVLVDSPCIDMN